MLSIIPYHSPPVDTLKLWFHHSQNFPEDCTECLPLIGASLVWADNKLQNYALSLLKKPTISNGKNVEEVGMPEVDKALQEEWRMNREDPNQGNFEPNFSTNKLQQFLESTNLEQFNVFHNLTNLPAQYVRVQSVWFVWPYRLMQQPCNEVYIGCFIWD